MSVLEKFKLVELITSRTDSVATFMNGNQIKFNAATFVDLGYPEYIQLFVEEKGKQFAIKACKADAPQAIKFSKPAGEQRYPIKISCAPAANAVRRVMQWAPEESWNVPGASFKHRAKRVANEISIKIAQASIRCGITRLRVAGQVLQAKEISVRL